MLAAVVPASDPPLSESEVTGYIQKFVSHQLDTQTYQADLKQIFHWSFPRKHTESEGRIYYQAPDSLAIILTKPAAETTLVRGDDLYFKRPSKPLVHRKLTQHQGRPRQRIQFLMAFFQNGGTNYMPQFTVGVARATNGLTVTLTPKSKLQMLRSVNTAVGWPSLELQSMRIGLIIDSYIGYEFSHGTRNQPLDTAVFQIPADE